MNVEDLTVKAQLDDELSKPLDKVRKSVKDTEKAVAGAGKESDKTAAATGRLGQGFEKSRGAGARMFDGIKGGASSAFAKGGALLAKGAAGAALAVGAAAGAAIAKGISGALEKADLRARLDAALGLNAAGAARYSQVATDVYTDAWGESISEVGSAVEAVASAIPGMRKASEQALTDMTTDVMGLSSIFGIDTVASVNAVRTLLTNGLAPDARSAVDMMTVGLQRVPSYMRGEMVDALDEYAVHFETLGIKGPQAIAMLADAGKRLGNIGIDKVGDAVKEFTIRATDMSTGSKDAFDLIGLSQRDMADAIVAGGDRSQEALAKITRGLLEVESPSARANAAIALFGTPVEDLSVRQIPGFLKSLSGAEDGLGDFEGAAKKAQDAVTDSPAQRFKEWRRSAEGNLIKFAETHLLPLGESLSGVFEGIASAVQWAASWWKKSAGDADGLGGAMSSLGEFTDKAQRAWEVFGPYIKKAGELWLSYLVEKIKAVAKGLNLMADAAIWLWNNAFQPLITRVLSGFAEVSEAVGRTLQIMGKAPGMGWVGELGDKLVGAASGARNLADNIKQIPRRVTSEVEFSVYTRRVETSVNGSPTGPGSGMGPQPIGDTAGSRWWGRSGGALAGHSSVNAALGGRYMVSNTLLDGGGLGAGSGDHSKGRAIDVVGPNLEAYAAETRRQGGYAAIHGAGTSKHVHAVPSYPAGDTPGPRRVARESGGRMSTQVVFGEGSVVVSVGAGADGRTVKRAVKAGIREALRDAEEAGD